jgi:hypothetical protein
VRSSKTDVELAAEVQVYSDPASTLRTMAHNHSASQDVVLTPIQETSGKPQSPTLMDLDIQDRGYHLRRIPLPRTPVNKLLLGSGAAQDAKSERQKPLAPCGQP